MRQGKSNQVAHCVFLSLHAPLSLSEYYEPTVAPSVCVCLPDPPTRGVQEVEGVVGRLDDGALLVLLHLHHSIH